MAQLRGGEVRAQSASHTKGRRQFAPRALLNLFKLPSLNNNKTEARGVAKAELLSLIKPLQRGAGASPAQQEEVDDVCSRLESLNPNPKTLASPLVNGKWELLYTTSTSVNGSTRPPPFRPWGPIYQTIDAINLKARNTETTPFFNQVSADLEPMSATKVKVVFKQFKILGLIPITAPPTAVGSLDITYVDEELRISRGDKGNLFVLRMVDRDAVP